ncbi:LysR family transcriptional regulator [Alcaligenaceae bacterium]|nr:LysR family transcriptional regulator [Alcaligenaceae bacterium]
MKLHELRSIRAVVETGFSVTAAAEVLHTSQPGISRHVQQAERYLAVELFTRVKNRLTGLTPAGQVLVPMIIQVLDQLEGVRRVAGQFNSGDQGQLTVATSHTHARYLLPPVIEAFIRSFPQVRLTLRQGYGAQIAAWLQSGEADLSISSAPQQRYSGLSFRRIGKMRRIVLTAAEHPLLKAEPLTLQSIVAYPIITYSPEFAAYSQIMAAFEAAGLRPTIALSTGDTDTIKTYTVCGLGVAIVADSAFEPQRDQGLCAIDAGHLFPSTNIVLGMSKEREPTFHALKLIELLKSIP